MATFQKLIQNGSSTVVTIPRPVMRGLDWLPGEMVVVEVTPKKEFLIRRPNANDFSRSRSPRVPTPLMPGVATE